MKRRQQLNGQGIHHATDKRLTSDDEKSDIDLTMGNAIKRSKKSEQQQEDKTESDQESFSPIQSVCHELNAQKSTRESRINGTRANVPSILVKIDLDKLNNNKNKNKSWHGETSTDETDLTAMQTKLDFNCSKGYASLERIRKSTAESTDDLSEENSQCSHGTSDCTMYPDKELIADSDEGQIDDEEIETHRLYDKNGFLDDKVKEYEKDIKGTAITLHATRLRRKYVRIKKSFRTYFGRCSDTSESEEDGVAVLKSENKKNTRELHRFSTVHSTDTEEEYTAAAEEERDNRKRRKRSIHEYFCISDSDSEVNPDNAISLQDIKDAKDTSSVCEIKCVANETDTLTRSNDKITLPATERDAEQDTKRAGSTDALSSYHHLEEFNSDATTEEENETRDSLQEIQHSSVDDIVISTNIDKLTGETDRRSNVSVTSVHEKPWDDKDKNDSAMSPNIKNSTNSDSSISSAMLDDSSTLTTVATSPSKMITEALSMPLLDTPTKSSVNTEDVFSVSKSSESNAEIEIKVKSKPESRLPRFSMKMSLSSMNATSPSSNVLEDNVDTFIGRFIQNIQSFLEDTVLMNENTKHDTGKKSSSNDNPVTTESNETASNTLNSVPVKESSSNQIINNAASCLEQQDSSNNINLFEGISIKKSNGETNVQCASVEQKATLATTPSNRTSVESTSNKLADLNKELSTTSLDDGRKNVDEHISRYDSIKVRSVKELTGISEESSDCAGNLSLNPGTSGSRTSTPISSRASFSPSNTNITPIRASSMTSPSCVPIENIPPNVNIPVELMNLMRNICNNFQECRRFSCSSEVTVERLNKFYTCVLQLTRDLKNLELYGLNNSIDYINQFMLIPSISLGEYLTYKQQFLQFRSLDSSYPILRQHLNLNNPCYQSVPNVSPGVPTSNIPSSRLPSTTNQVIENIPRNVNSTNVGARQSLGNTPMAPPVRLPNFGNPQFSAVPSSNQITPSTDQWKTPNYPHSSYSRQPAPNVNHQHGSNASSMMQSQAAKPNANEMQQRIPQNTSMRCAQNIGNRQFGNMSNVQHAPPNTTVNATSMMQSQVPKPNANEMQQQIPQNTSMRYAQNIGNRQFGNMSNVQHASPTTTATSMMQSHAPKPNANKMQQIPQNTSTIYAQNIDNRQFGNMSNVQHLPPTTTVSATSMMQSHALKPNANEMQQQIPQNTSTIYAQNIGNRQFGNMSNVQHAPPTTTASATSMMQSHAPKPNANEMQQQIPQNTSMRYAQNIGNRQFGNMSNVQQNIGNRQFGNMSNVRHAPPTTTVNATSMMQSHAPNPNANKVQQQIPQNTSMTYAQNIGNRQFGNMSNVQHAPPTATANATAACHTCAICGTFGCQYHRNMNVPNKPHLPNTPRMLTKANKESAINAAAIPASNLQAPFQGNTNMPTYPQPVSRQSVPANRCQVTHNLVTTNASELITPNVPTNSLLINTNGTMPFAAQRTQVPQQIPSVPSQLFRQNNMSGLNITQTQDMRCNMQTSNLLQEVLYLISCPQPSNQTQQELQQRIPENASTNRCTAANKTNTTLPKTGRVEHITSNELNATQKRHDVCQKTSGICNVTESCAAQTSSERLTPPAQRTMNPSSSRDGIEILMNPSKTDPINYDFYYKFDLNLFTDAQKIILHKNLKEYMSIPQNVSVQNERDILSYELEKLLFFYICLDKDVNKIKDSMAEKQNANVGIQLPDDESVTRPQSRMSASLGSEAEARDDTTVNESSGDPRNERLPELSSSQDTSNDKTKNHQSFISNISETSENTVNVHETSNPMQQNSGKENNVNSSNSCNTETEQRAAIHTASKTSVETLSNENRIEKDVNNITPCIVAENQLGSSCISSSASDSFVDVSELLATNRFKSTNKLLASGNKAKQLDFMEMLGANLEAEKSLDNGMNESIDSLRLCIDEDAETVVGSELENKDESSEVDELDLLNSSKSTISADSTNSYQQIATKEREITHPKEQASEATETERETPKTDTLEDTSVANEDATRQAIDSVSTEMEETNVDTHNTIKLYSKIVSKLSVPSSHLAEKLPNRVDVADDANDCTILEQKEQINISNDFDDDVIECVINTRCEAMYQMSVPSICNISSISSLLFEKMDDTDTVIQESEFSTVQESSSSANNDLKESQEYLPCLRCRKNSTVCCAYCLDAHYCSKRCSDLYWKAIHHRDCKGLSSTGDAS